MSKIHALRKTVGANAIESMGKADIPLTDGTAALKAVTFPMSDQQAGRSRWREAAYMTLDHIVPDPDQPRKTFSEESIKQLASSLQAVGQINPITIRWNPELGKHIIKTGERRYRAAKLLGWTAIKCVTDDSDQAAEVRLQEQLIENCQREDLNDIEKAVAFETLRSAHGWNQPELAAALAVSVATVSRTLCLLKLPEDVQAKVANGQLAPSVAYQAAKATNPNEQRTFVEKVTSEGLTRDEASQIAPKNAESKRGRPSMTTKKYKTEKAEVTVKFKKKRVTDADVKVALETVIDQLSDNKAA